MEKHLKDLDFSVTALNSFKQADINTEKELIECNPNIYKKLNFSNRTIMEIKDYKTLHENKNDLEQFITKQPTWVDVFSNVNNLVYSLDRFTILDNKELIEDLDGEYVLFSSVLNLFAPKK